MISFADYSKYVEQRIQTAVHDCPRLGECESHPRWHVFRDAFSQGWWAASSHHVNILPTHAEAIQYADRKARQ